MSARDEYADFRDGFITFDKIADDAVTTYKITDAGLEALADLLDGLDDETQAATIARTRMGRELVTLFHQADKAYMGYWTPFEVAWNATSPAWRSVLDQEEG